MYWFVHLGDDHRAQRLGRDEPRATSTSTCSPSTSRASPRAPWTREQAKELLACFWIKFNNHPAPPKVGVTAEESGTYNDFTNINLGRPDARRRRAARTR